MSLSTDTATRQAFITGLRDLADYLDRHPAVPVPAYGTEILLCASSADDGGCAQVNHFARHSSASPSRTAWPATATTKPSGPSARSATGSSPSPTPGWPSITPTTPTGAASPPTSSPTPGPDA